MCILYLKNTEKTVVMVEEKKLVSFVLFKTRQYLDISPLYDVRLDFCTLDGEEQALWQRVTAYAQDMYAMKDVFAMDSTVRVDAIENMGKLSFS